MVDLKKLTQKRARLEASLAAAATTLRDAERRADSRRKIVAGAALLSAARDGTIAPDVLPLLVRRMTPRDAALFPEVTAAGAIESEGAVR